MPSTGEGCDLAIPEEPGEGVTAKVLHLLHEHPVVSLSGHACMCEAQDGAESVHAEVALPAAALSAGGRGVLHRHIHLSSYKCCSQVC